MSVEAAPRLSMTSAQVQGANTGITPLYDRQYITLHQLLEKEMRQRMESERMIRNDMTQLQEGIARLCNQVPRGRGSGRIYAG